jgi:hypothetical protein
MRKLQALLSHKLLGLFTICLLVVSAVSIGFAQDDTLTSSDPVQRALTIAEGAIEELEGEDIRIVRWEFYQDDWGTQASWQKYGTFGIDNCVADVLLFEKRFSVVFGWTFNITDTSNERYQVRVSFDLNDYAVCDEAAPAPTRAAAPATTEVETVNEDGETVTVEVALPQAATGSANVSGFALGGHVDGLTPQAVGLMQSAGMTWVKKQIPMAAGVGKGIEFINAAHANGFKILLGVVGDKGALGADFDGYSAQAASFMAQLAAAGADAIEVWNEPNLDREWPKGQINGANYTRLLAQSYNAIKAANPSTIVISGAPAPTGAAGAAGCIDAYCNDDVFMQQMADAGAANYMDCIGLHYNEGNMPPSAVSGDPLRSPDYPSYFFSSMLSRGYNLFGGKKVCFTELGYLSGEGMGAEIPGTFAWAGNTTVSQHAAWLAEAAAASAQSGKVAIMIVWNVNFTRWDTDPMGGYAMLRPDGSCPACQTLGAVMGG